MTITPQFLDELKSRLTLSDVIGGRIKLIRSGREFKACCPFHKEKSASFYVNDDKNFFHCFGCGAHGDAVGFIMRLENRSFPEAVEQLATSAGMKMPALSKEDAVQAQKQQSFYSLMEAAAAWFEAQLSVPKNQGVMGYLTGRGLTIETIHAFRLGYACADDKSLYTHLKSLGFDSDMMVTMGLIKYRERDQTPYDFFRDRVIFPVTDRSGRVVAFGGRILPDDMRSSSHRSDFKPPKYLNSPETPLFQKGRMIYAQAQARAAAGAGQPIIVVEGYMDVIACHQAGFKGAVAPLGTAMTEDQVQLLWKMIPGQDKTITLCFDGDEAGRRAAVRAVDRMLPLLKPDHSARIAFLPDGEDPDTLIAGRGIMAFQQVIETGQPLAEFLWAGSVARRSLVRPEDRAGLEAELESLVNRVLDPKIKYYYQKFFREKMNLEFRPAPRVFSGQKGMIGGSPVLRPTMVRSRESDLLAIDILLATLINHPNIFMQVDEKIGNLIVDDHQRDSVRLAIIDVLSVSDIDEKSSFRNLLCEKYPNLQVTLEDIFRDQIMIHARFARSSADVDEVLQGFYDTYDLLERRQNNESGRLYVPQTS